MTRFQYFIPRGEKTVFGKYRNTNEEDVVVNNTPQDRPDLPKLKAALLKRRKKELKQDNRRFYMFRRLAFKTRFNFYDVTKYVAPEHIGVELKDVTVYTSPDKVKEECIILRGITVSARRSDIIGIIGRTGAGKTTLLSVLENTMRSRTGRVLLDGTDMNDIPRPVLDQIIGVLPQLPFAFKGWTIRRFLDPRKLFSDGEIYDALEKCELLEFVITLPGGKKLDSVIIHENLVGFVSVGNIAGTDKDHSDQHETDMLLSNSQLRTLSFARLVLYRKFYRIILVDEPPENVESDSLVKTVVSENLGVPIYELLKRYFQHCTTFLTARDATALRTCCSVWVIHDGRLIRTCKASEFSTVASISEVIEDCVKRFDK